MDCTITWASRIMELTQGPEGLSYLDNPVNKNICLELKQIWKECYHDTEEYIDLFFQNRFEPGSAIIMLDGEQIIGAGYLLGALVIKDNTEVPVMFGYALGIRKEYRGQGLAYRVIDFINQYCDQNGYIFIAHPAHEKLMSYYERNGLEKAGNIKKSVLSYPHPTSKQKILLENINSSEYAKFRNRFFLRDGYLKWDQKAVDYAVLENYFCGGFCKKLTCQTEEYALLGRLKEDSLYIMETTIPADRLCDLTSELAAYYRVTQITVCLSADSEAEGTVLPWIMGHNAEILQNGYCNLLLN